MQRVAILVCSVLLAIGSALVESWSAMGATLWVLALVPMGIVGWYVGWRWGAGVGFLAIALGYVLPQASDLPVGSSGGTAEIAVRVTVIALFAVALRAVRQVLETAEPIRSDGSTGLANGRAFFEAVAQEVERAARYDRPFTMAYLAVENLPTVHRRAGPAAAEDVLRRVAHHIRGSLRASDVTARLRDREFALLLPETSFEPAGSVLARLDRSLAAALGGEPLGVACCIGAITWTGGEVTAEALHQRAYQLMYAARASENRMEHEVYSVGEPFRRTPVTSA